MDEIEDFFEIYRVAAWEKDFAAMIHLYDKGAVVFDTWNRGFIPDAMAWGKTITQWLTSLGDEKVKVEFEMINIHESGGCGFASALIQYQAISKEGTVLRSMKNRITLGFLKSEGEWKVAHHHTSAPIGSDLIAILNI